jgi:hypothetical protein
VLRLRVLVACEFSGRVRDAFTAAGHDAWSADMREPLTPGQHHVGDCRDLFDQEWDLIIAHPPCTYLANSGVQHLHTKPGRWEAMEEGAAFFLEMLNAPAPHVAVENPVPHPYARDIIGRASQWIQPYEYGTLESKQTGLWLRGLPPLIATQDGKAATAARPARERMPGWWKGSNAERQGLRSITAPGIGEAMAEQWGTFVAELREGVTA